MTVSPAIRRACVFGLCAAAVGLAIALRLHQAAASMVYDEFASLYFSGRPFGDLWGWWMLRETNPPLFYSLLKLWRAIVPESQAALRLLPLLLSLGQIVLVSRFAGRTYGGLAAVLCALLFALSPSDIYQSEYLRGYVLAKLAVTVSFIGLVVALDEAERTARGWAWYVGGAVVAIYSHTTMLLWPVIATLAVFGDRALGGDRDRISLKPLFLADLAIVALSGWVVWFATAQLRLNASDISWIVPLSFDDYVTSLRLQLLLDAPVSSGLMAILMLVGLLRTWRYRVTRLSLLIVAITVVAFKAADFVHPIVSDFTLHWCATFTALIAAAALAGQQRGGITIRALAAIALAVMTAEGLIQLRDEVWIPQPQDFVQVVGVPAKAPQAALLVSHESMGVVTQQACRLEFHRPACPFPLVVMASAARSDGWATGGYAGPIVPASRVPVALGPVRNVYVFSRYVYAPLAQLGMSAHRYRTVAWDDGELIGPIPIADFPATRARQ